MFESHGRFVVCRQGNILKVDATGPFNHEAVENYQEDVVDAIKYLDEPWGQLILMHENCLYTPQAAQAMYHFAELRQKLGLVAIALVFIDKNAMLIVQDKISDFYHNNTNLHIPGDITVAFYTAISFIHSPGFIIFAADLQVGRLF